MHNVRCFNVCVCVCYRDGHVLPGSQHGGNGLLHDRPAVPSQSPIRDQGYTQLLYFQSYNIFINRKNDVVKRDVDAQTNALSYMGSYGTFPPAGALRPSTPQPSSEGAV